MILQCNPVLIPRLAAGLAVALILGCGRGETAAPAGSKPPVDSAAARPAVVFLGTSLTAGLGLDPEQAYPALIQRKIDSAGLGYRVVNAGVSGETSAGSRRQAEWLLGRQPVSVLVVETGANDGLRGLDVDALRANVQAIIDRARAATPAPKVVLVGMEAPPNLGGTYTRRFREVYRGLAVENGVPLVPFLLESVAGIDSLNQSDGVHPTAAGQRLMAETVWKVLEGVLRARA
jgi:acyl-CoA thioesterase-1